MNSFLHFSSMVCSKCGKEHPDTIQCFEVNEKTLPYNTQTERVYAPIMPLILFGIIIILAMYLLPLDGVPLARRADLCSSPSFIFYNCPGGISWIVFLGWLAGVACIIAGMFRWKNQ